MASKLELRFKSPGILGEYFTVKTGISYIFAGQRLGLRQVGIFDPYLGLQTHFAVASNFRDAYNADDNYLGQSTVTMQEVTTDAAGTALPDGTTHWLVIIENQDNNFFTGHGAGTSFMDASLTTTTQEVSPTLEVNLAQAADACANYKVQVTTNIAGKKILVESPMFSSNYVYLTSSIGTQEVEFARPSQAITGRVTLYENEGDIFPILSVLFNPPQVLTLESVSVEGSPFGALVTINAEGENLEYSLNGTTWQGSQQYARLLAGNYTAYVRDQFGCQKTRTFVVTQEQASKLSAPPLFQIAKHNAIHFVDTSQDNFLGHISEDIKANAPIRVVQDWLQTDSPRTQFKSSFSDHTIKLYGCGTQQIITPVQKSDNINRVNIYEGNYTEKDGKLAVHFTSGNIYNPDGSIQPEGHVLNGRLPLWYKAGIFIDIEGVGVTKIIRILYEDNIAYAVTQQDPAGTITNKKITSIHSEHPYEVFEFDMPAGLTPGNYIFEIDFGADPYISEIQRVNETLNDQYLKVTWYNNELNDQLMYATGIRPFRRIKYDKYFNYIGQNEREIYSTDTSIKLIRSKSKAVYELDFRPTAMEIARGMIDGLNHASHIEINGAVFICNSSAKPENFGNWYFVKTELALIGQTVESIEADLTQINVQFLKVKDDATGVGFLQV